MLNRTGGFSDKPVFHLLVISFVCVLIYSNIFSAPFVFDDDDSIVQNSVIRNPENYFVNSTGYRSNPSRYIGYLTFAVNYRFSGLDVAGYHVFNLFVHILNSLLVYYLVLITFRTPHLRNSSLSPSSRSLAFFTASLFAVHPVQTQAVTYIVQRLTSLCVLFYLVSICCYVKARLCYESENLSIVKVLLLYSLSLFAAVLAMKTKEISFTLPFMAAIYEFFFFKGNMKKRAGFLAPMLLTVLVIPIGLLTVETPLGKILSDVSDVTRVQTDLSRWDYLMTQFCVITTYIRLLLFPYGQNLDYNYPVYQSFFMPRVFLSFLFLSALLMTAILLFLKSRKDAHSHLRLVAFGILWFFITLSVESSVIPIVDVIFEHRLYLPSIGAVLAMVVAAGSFSAGNVADRNRKIITAICFLIVLCFSYATFQRNAIWGSSVSLWEDVVKKSPGKARPLNHLGVALSSSGRNDEAAKILDEAIQIDPAYAKAYNNLGIARSRQGLQEDAEKMFLNAIRLNPELASAYYNLGRIYLVHQGKYDQAIYMLQKTVALKPDFSNAFINMAAAYNQIGDFGEAVKVLENSIPESGRSPEAFYNLGVAYHGLKNAEAAKRQLEILRKKDPGLASRLGVVMSAGPRGSNP